MPSSDIPRPLFRTVIPVRDNPRKISHNKNIMLIGSCFSENIGEYLHRYKFNPCINPFGILYNPLSISKTLHRIISGDSFTNSDLFFSDDSWKSFQHHSKFNGATNEECLKKINDEFFIAHKAFKQLDTLIITFGTAYAYCHKESKEIVANCHKIPHGAFNRTLLPIEKIVQAYRELFDLIYTKHPSANIIVTVSPIRHLRDDPHENQVSKSHLIAAIEALQRLFSSLHYFPAYEIMMDELRDYRFYADDMCHPSSEAIVYIWDVFTKACITKKSQEFMDAYSPILKSLSHQIKSSNPSTITKFCQLQLSAIDSLKNRFPHIDFTEEYTFFKEQ